MALKIIITIIFLSIFFIRILKPELNIDTSSIIVLVLAVIPWIYKNIKSLEISGLGKIEFINEKQKKKIDKKAIDAGISNINLDDINKKYNFYNLRYDNPKLALAGLRIEIESILNEIAKKNNLKIYNTGLGNITNILIKKELIDKNEKAIISDIIVILNKAVHSQLEKYESESFDWVFDLGLKLLESLKSKL